MEDCIFCKIVAGEVPSHRVWEDEKHVAFLSIFPNTEGVTVVIPKAHYDSYVFDLEDEVMVALMRAARTVANQIDRALPDVGRTGLIFEGFGVNHVHAKLFPMHGTESDSWREHKSSIDTYFDTYPGYLSSHDGKREDDATLAATAEKLRASSK
jgi:histidine triad (HIT) family protein